MTASAAPPPDNSILTLQPKQERLLYAILDRRPDAPCVLGFGGSRGAAKSGGVRRIALALAMEMPGIIVWIIRRIWDDLNKDHVKPLFIEHPELKGCWHATDKELRLPVAGGESSIFFIHAGDTGRAKRKARGPQAHYIFLEQAEEFSEDEIQQLDGSNRAPGVVPGFCKKILTFNPGGIGTAYLRRVMWLRDFHDNEDPGNFMFIQGYGWDNYEWFRGLGIVSEDDFYNDPEWTAEMPAPIELDGNDYPVRPSRRFVTFVTKTDFGKKLFQLPRHQRIGELLGSFEKFAGQYYSEVWEPSACVLPVDLVARIVKPWWRRWLATDWGYSHYAATGWFAAGLLSPDEVREFFGVETTAPVRVVIMCREVVCNEVPEPDLAALVLARTPDAEKREIRDHWIGHDAWQGEKRASGRSVVEQMDPIFTRGGLPRLSRADIDRVGGWRLLYNCWASARRLRHWHGGEPYQQGPDEAPALFISAACVEVQSAVPMLICGDIQKDEDPKDVVKMNGQMADDVADMVRYGVKSYLEGSGKVPDEITRAETWSKHQSPDSRAMAMRQLEAAQAKGQYIYRRRRA